MEAIDYGVRYPPYLCADLLTVFQMANVHPWFANVSASEGAGWTADFFQTTNVEVANALPNKPKMYIAETGESTQVSFTKNVSIIAAFFQVGQQ